MTTLPFRLVHAPCDGWGLSNAGIEQCVNESMSKWISQCFDIQIILHLYCRLSAACMPIWYELRSMAGGSWKKKFSMSLLSSSPWPHTGSRTGVDHYVASVKLLSWIQPLSLHGLNGVTSENEPHRRRHMC